MARERRMIARSSFSSKKLSICKDSQFLLFVGLIVNADDEGRGEGEPYALKLKFPNRRWSETKIGTMMGHLSGPANTSLVEWYTNNGGLYYEVVDFMDYQGGSWHGRSAVPSKIPSPRDSDSEVNQSGGGSTPLTEKTETRLVGGGTKSASNRSEVNRSEVNRKDGARSKKSENHSGPANRVLEIWNGLEVLISHRALTETRRSRVNARLKDGYSEEDLVAAIQTYAMALSTPGDFYHDKEVRWTMEQFLVPKNVDRFLEYQVSGAGGPTLDEYARAKKKDGGGDGQ